MNAEEKPETQYAFSTPGARFMAQMLNDGVLKPENTSWTRFLHPSNYSLPGTVLIGYATKVQKEYDMSESAPMDPSEAKNTVNGVLTEWKEHHIIDEKFASILSTYFNPDHVISSNGTTIQRNISTGTEVTISLMDEPNLEKRLSAIFNRVGVSQSEDTIRQLTRKKHAARMLGHVVFTVLAFESVKDAINQFPENESKAKFSLDSRYLILHEMSDIIYRQYPLDKSSRSIVTKDNEGRMQRRTSEVRVAKGFEYLQFEADLEKLSITPTQKKQIIQELRKDNMRYEQDILELQKMARKKGIDFAKILSSFSDDVDTLIRHGIPERAAKNMLSISPTRLGESNGLTPSQVNEWFTEMKQKYLNASS